MNVIEAIRSRRSVKSFTDRPVPREELERLVGAAVLAPNHRMTEPWRFLVLGEEAKSAYGRVLGGRKARKVEDEDAARMVREKVSREMRSVPAMVVVTMREDDDPEIREEDYASCLMGVQNMCLAAVELGLGTHIKSGGVMNDPALRAAWGVEDGRTVVAIVFVGEPAEVPSGKERTPAGERTRWLP